MIVSGTNDLRQQQGQSKVQDNGQLTEAAREFALFLSRSEMISHTADGRQPDERAKQHGYDYCLVSENIAYQYSSEGFSADQLARELVQGWERSPGHRKNMHHPDVTEIGVAVAHNAHSGNYYAVQMFGRPQSASMAFEIGNRSGVVISYAFSGRSYSLEPSYSRTHRECGAVQLEVQWPGEPAPLTVAARNGDRYTVVRDGAGKFEIKKE